VGRVHRKGGGGIALPFFIKTKGLKNLYINMIQLYNSGLPSGQPIVLKLDGYSTTSTTELIDVRFTNQFSNEQTLFESIILASTNERYQKFFVVVPTGDDKMHEGLYLVEVMNTAQTRTYATSLAFVEDYPIFSEDRYKEYTAGDNTAYNVYVRQ
jgi:hypothetical protein